MGVESESNFIYGGISLLSNLRKLQMEFKKWLQNNFVTSGQGTIKNHFAEFLKCA